MARKLLNAKEVGEILGVSKQRVYELTREKKLPFVLLGDRQYRYSETAIFDWIDNGGTNEQREVEK